jgi:hypothetical protein
MKKTFAMILMSAASVTATGYATAATAEAKAKYTAANASASADFKLARAKCDSLIDNPKDVCIAEAKAARTFVEANAKAEYKDTLSAQTTATKDIADANYYVEKAKCGSQTGNAKDVCIKAAKSNKVAVVSNAKADKKIVEALTDAREDKNTAEYKVVLEKCDASTGAAKDACVAAAKKKFDK